MNTMAINTHVSFRPRNTMFVLLNTYVFRSSTHPAIHQPTQPFINPPSHSSTHPGIHQPTQPFINPPSHSSTHPAIHQPTQLFINPPSHSSTQPAIHQPTQPFINPPTLYTYQTDGFRLILLLIGRLHHISIDVPCSCKRKSD